jgi:ABC-2 type transport system permease protein
MWLAVHALWRRDVRRFLGQRSRVAGSLATPVVFWALLGAGLGRSFQAGGAETGGGYLQFFFPGTLAMIVLFSAIFSTISVIEDRQQGFMQGVLAAPVPRSAIVLGKLLGGTTIALWQAALFLLLAPLAGIPFDVVRLGQALGVAALLALALTGLGFILAWWLNSTQGFHAIMNLLLVPMWLLSGAVFPASGAAPWIQWLMRANPMTYGVSALQSVLLGQAGGPSLAVSMAVTAAFGAAMLAGGVLLVDRRRAG